MPGTLHLNILLLFSIYLINDILNVQIKSLNLTNVYCMYIKDINIDSLASH